MLGMMSKKSTTINNREEEGSLDGLDHLIPIYDDETHEHECPTSSIAFRHIKRKVLRELYGLDDNHTYNHQLLKDKSPKGSVDEDIRSLVDLINSHPYFVTLSSCSGRIALFNPISENTTSSSLTIDSLVKEGNNDEDTEIVEPRGKGYGTWLLSSHAEISSLQLIQSLDRAAHELSSTSTTNTPTLFFKHEPLLLHVAVAHLTQAKILLQIALDLGFRESGMVYTPKRITVAIRCHSLALNVPLSARGPLRPSDEYLHGLILEANTRFQLNQQKLILLYKKIETTFFTQVPRNHSTFDSTTQPEAYVLHSLPDLNLWGHSAVSITSPTHIDSYGDDVDIFVFGGYGFGPTTTTLVEGCQQRKKSTRSKHVYQLKRRKLLWDHQWTHVPESPWDCSKEVISYDTHFGKLYAKRTLFYPCEGLSACVLSSLNSKLVAVFGGRDSPLKPNNKLLLFDAGASMMGFSEPLDIVGESPSPRWGHSLVALSGHCGHLAMVVGGRDESQILSTAYILSMGTNDSSSEIPIVKLVWSRLDLGIESYYPSVISLPPNDNSTQDDVFVLGGLRTLDDPFSIFTTTRDMESDNKDLHISFMERSTTLTILQNYGTCYGASSCALVPIESRTKGIYILFSGGFDPKYESQVSPFVLRLWNVDSNTLGAPIPCNISRADSETSTLNFGSLVHHVALSIPSTTNLAHEVVIIGGGTSLFAFGESFAKSYAVSMRYHKSLTQHIRPKLSKAEPMIHNKPEFKDPLTSVLFVQKSDAKQLKTALETRSFLDRRFRMITASEDAPLKDPSSYVAVPVTEECLRLVDLVDSNLCENNSTDMEWVKLIVGCGQQNVPRSSAYFGSRNR